MLEALGGAIDKEYLPIDGLPSLKPLTQKLVFGGAADNFVSIQSLSGTGSLRVCGEFLNTYLKKNKIFISDPTWGNHIPIFQKCGFTVEKYPYWNPVTRGIKFDEYLNHLKSSPDGSVYLLHSCAHNPTGVDPTEAQWEQIIATCVAKKHVVILDSAYQGYASGCLEHDRKSIQMLLKTGAEFFVCQSFAKNLGLYGERAGMLHIVCNSAERAVAVLSQVKLVSRPMFSNPPLHGAHLVAKILGDEAMYKQWTVELKTMADRILSMRAKLREGLEKKGTPGTWNHITDQIGMFSFTGLTPRQCEAMIKDHAIYLLTTGRISLAGLNENNIQYVVDAIDDVVTRFP